ncbi:hypothetical protein ACO2XV_06585 [Escherichia coli]
MDDIVNSVPSWMFTAIIAVCILFIIGIILRTGLDRRASADASFCSYSFRWAKSGNERWRNRDADLS